MHRRYPVLNHQEMSRSSRSSRTEFVHATVEDDLIGPGHVRSRSRSRTRSSSKPRITTPLVGSSGLLVKPGLEIYLPQRGRYIVVEDDYKKKKNHHNHHQPEFVLVNKENGRAIPLHSLYQNPGSSSRIADPPVDYYYDHQRSSGSVISSSSSSIRVRQFPLEVVFTLLLEFVPPTRPDPLWHPDESTSPAVCTLHIYPPFFVFSSSWKYHITGAVYKYI